MDSISISLKVMYCKGLQAFNFFQKLLLYVFVSIVSDDPNIKLKQNHQQRTPTDKEGDGDPEWNYQMQLDLNEVSSQDFDHLFVHFEIRHEGLYFGDKTIGEVRVPLKDVIEEINGIVRFVSYEVRGAEGKPNGILNFSYKVNRKGKDNSSSSPTCEISGFPIVHHSLQSPGTQNPTSEMQSSSSEIHYPLLDLERDSRPQEIYAAPQVHYPLPDTNYPSQENYYPPPDAYYAPPPPPPPMLHGPPPPPMVHGACYRHPHPPVFQPWPLPYMYDQGPHQNLPTAGETWTNGVRAWRDRPSPIWNGRSRKLW